MKGEGDWSSPPLPLAPLEASKRFLRFRERPDRRAERPSGLATITCGLLAQPLVGLLPTVGRPHELPVLEVGRFLARVGRALSGVQPAFLVVRRPAVGAQ